MGRWRGGRLLEVHHALPGLCGGERPSRGPRLVPGHHEGEQSTYWPVCPGPSKTWTAQTLNPIRIFKLCFFFFLHIYLYFFARARAREIETNPLIITA